MKDVGLILYHVADMTQAKRFFSELTGAEPYVDSPQYVGYKNGAVEIGLTPNTGQLESIAVPYWEVADIAASVQALEAHGGTVVQKIRDVGYGMLVASVKEPGGSVVGLRQPPKA
ncbi:MAG: VOC family protein [Vulcanimicrobiaceae bacterium]